MKRNARGFTLVEILIVVIILGILAAIVIPQFTNASTDARNNSTASTLQTIRSQLALFKIQHSDTPPQTTGMAHWVVMLNKSSTNDTGTVATVPSGTNFGPYLQTTPANPLTSLTGTSSTASDATTGWYYAADTSNYTIYPRSLDGTSITTF
jgi:general secretion pathway protein G